MPSFSLNPSLPPKPEILPKVTAHLGRLVCDTELEWWLFDLATYDNRCVQDESLILSSSVCRNRLPYSVLKDFCKKIQGPTKNTFIGFGSTR